MKRFGVLALVAALSAAGGCASSAKFVERKADSGIVAVPDDSNQWPNYNRRVALKAIEEHVGPNYEIVDERTVKTGRQSRSSLPDTNETLNPRNPGAPAYRNASTHATALPEQTQYQITYRRKAGPEADPSGLGAVRTQYLPTGAAPNVQPAGGAVPGGMASPFNRPTVPPAAGGADCDH
ncbi:MAG TPA: hypothetical protein VGE74_06630 [Gemmata sp.]